MADRDFREALSELQDDYEILDIVGEGGSSVVYRARERELDRDVAIKVTRELYLNDPEAMARAEREAHTLARLRHPNIVAIHTARRLHNGSLALVMQLSQGRTLRAALEQDGPFPYDRIVKVLRDVAEALAYLHDHRIVHRDIKPENIFLEEGETVRALLADFGIAKLNDVQTELTLAGVVVGTPVYMSPEQIDGSTLDGRSDLYSLGVVGYEMLTGKRPWEGENLYTILYKQKHEHLPSPDAIRPDLPSNLRLAIGRALPKEREYRWLNARELVAFLDAGTVPPSWLPRASPAPVVPPVEEPAPAEPPVPEPAPASRAATAPASKPKRKAYRERLLVAAGVIVSLMGGALLASRLPPRALAETTSPPGVTAPADIVSEGSPAPLELGSLLSLPELANRDEVADLISAAYPRRLKESGIGGTIWLSLSVNENGRVVGQKVARSSGREALDAAALRVAPKLKFTPTPQAGGPVVSDILMPLVFQPESAP